MSEPTASKGFDFFPFTLVVVIEVLALGSMLWTFCLIHSRLSLGPLWRTALRDSQLPVETYRCPSVFALAPLRKLPNCRLGELRGVFGVTPLCSYTLEPAGLEVGQFCWGILPAWLAYGSPQQQALPRL